MIFPFLNVLLSLPLHFHPGLPLLQYFCSSYNKILNSSYTVQSLDGLISYRRKEKYIKGTFCDEFDSQNQTIVGKGINFFSLFLQYLTTNLEPLNTITTHSNIKRNRRSNSSKQIFQKRKTRRGGNVLVYRSLKRYQTVNHSFFDLRRQLTIEIKQRKIRRRRRRRRNIKINYKRSIIDFDFDVANWRLNVNYGRHPTHKHLPLSTITFTPWTLFMTMLSCISYLMTAETTFLANLIIAAQIVNG